MMRTRILVPWWGPESEHMLWSINCKMKVDSVEGPQHMFGLIDLLLEQSDKSKTLISLTSSLV